MTARPILFSGPLVLALLADEKTQTRRLVTEATSIPYKFVDGEADRQPWPSAIASCRRISTSVLIDGSSTLVKPRIEVDDELWVRENFEVVRVEDVKPRARVTIRYAADGEVAEIVDKKANAWARSRVRSHPSIHMPKWGSRITLRVTDVAAERLTDITHVDALREGVKPDQPGNSARVAFARLWNEINGDRARWEDDPWVWVVSFVRVRP